MLVALSLIFVGVKRYRDVECGGVIRFGRAFLLGLGIAAVAGAGLRHRAGRPISAATGIDFMAEYSASLARQACAPRARPPPRSRPKAAEMRAMAEIYRNPLIRIPITFTEIFPVGLLVALVSAALLRNPKMLPARG